MTVAWKTQQELGNRYMIRLMARVALSCGRPVARALLFPICLYYLCRSPTTNRTVRAYYMRTRGRSPSRSDLFHHYYWFASTVLDRLYFLRGRFDQFDITISGADILGRALAVGRGCLLLGSHLGSFEVVRAVGLAREQFDIKVLMDEGNAPLMRAFFREVNPAVADNVLQVGRPDTMLRVQECLDGGGIVGIMGDRLTSQSQAVYCDFLGAKAPFPTGTMRLAHAVRVPVVMFFGLYRGGNRYHVHLELLSEQIHLSSDQREDDIRRWTQRYADRLAHYSRQAADNWFNFYDFWQLSA
jgi:predicted LPLAT superfamily acyltransferase